MPKLYPVENPIPGIGLPPVYVVSNGMFYRTVHHPLGWSETPDYEFRSDGRLYRPSSDRPDYEFRGDGKLYRSAGHPSGPGETPEYVIRD